MRWQPRDSEVESKGVRLTGAQMATTYISASFGFGFPAMTNFLVPLRAEEMGAPTGLIGAIVGAGALLSVPLSLMMGRFIDSVGARRAYILGTGFTALCTLPFAAISNYWMLLILQLISGIPRGIPWIASQTYIAGIGSARERPAITSRFSFAANAGGLIAPLSVGAVADLTGYQYSFIFLAIVAAVYTAIGLGMADVRQEPARRQGETASVSSFSSTMQLVRTRPIQVMLAVTLSRLWIWSIWPSFFPIFLEDRGFSPTLIGTILSVRAGIATAATLGAEKVMKVMSKEVGAVCAIGIMGVGTALSSVLYEMPLVFIPAALIGAGDGLNLPLLLAITNEAAPSGRRGVATALRVAANQGASIVAPLAGGGIMAGTGMAGGFMVSSILTIPMLSGALWLYGDARRKNLMPIT